MSAKRAAEVPSSFKIVAMRPLSSWQAFSAYIGKGMEGESLLLDDPISRRLIRDRGRELRLSWGRILSESRDNGADGEGMLLLIELGESEDPADVVLRDTNSVSLPTMERRRFMPFTGPELARR